MANRFWFGGTGNWTDSAHWGTASNGVGAPVAAPVAGDAVTFDANSGSGTCTVNTASAISMGNLSLSGTSVSLDFTSNNNDVTITGLTTTGFVDASGTHTLSMGNGTWTVSGMPANVAWNVANAGLTLNCNSSTLVLPNTNIAAFRPGGKTYNNVSITGVGRWAIQTVGTHTFNNFSIAAGVHVWIDTGITLAITSATLVGTRALPIYIGVATLTATNPVISCPSGTVSLDYGILSAITGSGGATFTATNTIGYGTNTGWSISGPSAGGSAGVIGG